MLVILLTISSKTPLNFQFSSAAHIQIKFFCQVMTLYQEESQILKVTFRTIFPPYQYTSSFSSQPPNLSDFGGIECNLSIFFSFFFLLDIKSSLDRGIGWRLEVWTYAADENWKLKGVFDEIERRRTNMMIDLKLMGVN